MLNFEKVTVKQVFKFIIGKSVKQNRYSISISNPTSEIRKFSFSHLDFVYENRFETKDRNYQIIFQDFLSIIQDLVKGITLQHYKFKATEFGVTKNYLFFAIVSPESKCNVCFKKTVTIVSSENNFIFLPAFYMIMCSMKVQRILKKQPFLKK